MKKFLTIVPAALVFCALSNSQSSFDNKSEIEISSNDRLPKLNDVKKISIAKDESALKTELYFLKQYPYEFPAGNIKEEKPSLNLIASFRSNIRFGGFWDKYAIVNFTPQMFIKPFDFISIYANHNVSCFIPINAVKEHFKAMAIQGTAILAVDNSVKFLISSPLIRDIVSFAAKNIAIFYIMKSFNNGVANQNKMFDYENYYCAFSIRF